MADGGSTADGGGSSARSPSGSSRGIHPLAATAPSVSDLLPVLVKLGLTEYEGRVLAALIVVGDGTATQLARVSGISSRPNVYVRLESLEGKGLAYRRPGKVTHWTSPHREEIVDRLVAVQQERLLKEQAEVAERARDARELLSELAPPQAVTAMPEVQLVTNEVQMGMAYERLVGEVLGELLVCNLGPYGGEVRVANEVLEALERGVKARALYRSPGREGKQAAALKDTMAAYSDAGVDSRILDDLPLSMAMFDRGVVLLSLPDRSDPSAGFPAHLIVEHPAFGAWCAAAFEQLWSEGEPYPPVTEDRPVKGPSTASPEDLGRKS